MPRPRTPIGTYGEINTTKLPDGSYAAETYFRDFDGRSRRVKRTGPTKAAATNVLKEALRDRGQVQGEGELTARDPFSKGCDLWWKKVEEEGRLAEQTFDAYRRALKRIKEGLGERTNAEVTIPAAERFLKAIKAKHGASTAKMTKTVLSNVIQYLAVLGVMQSNIVRDTSRISAEPTNAAQALDIEIIRKIRKRTREDQVACRRDVPEFLDMLIGTGVRISEAAAVRPVDLDLSTGFVDISGIIVRANGKGLYRKERPNSKLKVRSLQMPTWLIEMLSERLDRMVLDGTFQEDGPVFPAPKGGWRDRSNTADDVRDALTAAGFPGVKPHAFRKTVLTEMDKAGYSARDAADRAGHAKVSMTQDKYFGRSNSVTAGVDVLEKFGASD